MLGHRKIVGGIRGVRLQNAGRYPREYRHITKSSFCQLSVEDALGTEIFGMLHKESQRDSSPGAQQIRREKVLGLKRLFHFLYGCPGSDETGGQKSLRTETDNHILGLEQIH